METESVLKPDWDDVGEKQQEAEDLQIPTAGKVLEGHHDQRHHHQSPKQNLGQTVHFQVKEANLEEPQGEYHQAVQIFLKHSQNSLNTIL